ncbi:hypothetical protein C8R45DRAFT_1103083 [Mycena sanguinolenta]|nr:hypothetical protein C8R45DRAFT_1103083 [Mycena sanguinolenta]
MGSLPQELIESIVEQVPDDETLLACALTAPAFVNASQRRIFSSMSLRNINVAAYERVADILPQSPHLSQYVRYLALYINNIPTDWDALQLILSTTTPVKRLVIQAALLRGRVRLSLNPSLIGFLSSKTLVCVALGKLTNVASSIVATLLETCEEICSFEMNIVLDEDAHAESPLPTSRPIRHLDLVDWNNTILPFLTLPRQLRSVSSLTQLSIVWDEDDDRALQLRDRLLAACAPTLEILKILLSSPFALPSLPSLRHLELWTYMGLGRIPAAVPSVSVALQATPRLRKLTVTIHE